MRQLDVSKSTNGFGLGSGTLIRAEGDNESRVARIAIGSSIDMSGVLEVGDLLQHEQPITEESKGEDILLTSKRSNKNKWILLNAPSNELRRSDPEQWNEILFALGDSEDGTTTSEDGDIIFTSSDIPPATLVWKYTKACKKDSKEIFGRVMMTRPFCESLIVKKVIEKTPDPDHCAIKVDHISTRCEQADTAAALKRAVREAKNMNLNISDAFKNLRRELKLKERKHLFRKSACVGDRVVSNNKIKVDEMFPILSSNHIDCDPIVHIMYLKFHRLEDEKGVLTKDRPEIVVNSNSTTFRTSSAEFIRVRQEKMRDDVRIFQWTDDEIMTFRFTGPDWIKSSHDIEFSLMDSKRKVNGLRKRWDDFKASSSPDDPDESNITELEFSDSFGNRAGTLHVSVSLYQL